MSNLKNKPKYAIKTYVTVEQRDKIIKALDIVKKTWYNKLSAKIGDKQGFEYCEMLKIASVLGTDVANLVTPEALEYYQLNNQ